MQNTVFQHFGALVLQDTGRTCSTGKKPYFHYQLLGATRPYPLDAVVLQKPDGRQTVVAQSRGVATLCSQLKTGQLTAETVIDALKQVILDEGAHWAKDRRWPLGENLAERKRLLENSTAYQGHPLSGEPIITIVKTTG